MVYTIVVAVFVLGVLIFVHELGHFLAAKMVDVQVLRFSIGLGKPFWARKWGETEYALCWIPFGGYVKMAGDDPAEGIEGEVDEDAVTTDSQRYFENKSVLQRFAVIFAGPLANFLLAVVLYQGIFFFQGADTIGGTVIEIARSDESIPGLSRIENRSEVLAVNGKQVENWEDILENVMTGAGDSTVLQLSHKESRQTYRVALSTPTDSTRRLVVSALVPFTPSEIGGLVPGKPAREAGLEPGDLIVSIEGQPIESWLDLTRIIHVSAGRELEIEVLREGKRLSYNITPGTGTIPVAGGELREVGLIGIERPMQRVEMSLGESLVEGAAHTVRVTVMITRSLANLLTGLVSRKISLSTAKDTLGGPVLIGQMAGEWARSGRLWAFMAILSINLAILNLLPIPVLDGGHLLFLMIEVVRFGKPLSVKQRMRMIQVGMLLVFALMILATANDIARLFGL
ncbi:MAG: RIP metalloprotease RseP [Candidatus Glassbacteria bacterium]|nr:RIP metalloprotease RseP [Candidatus Glassbacteria bacterium]